jgi:molybdate transport system regulatory protein
MRMSYRSAWLLVDSMNSLFRRPVVDTTLGGRGGGSATLTPFGLDLIRRYREMERATRRAIAKDLAALERNVRTMPPGVRRRAAR